MAGGCKHSVSPFTMAAPVPAQRCSAAGEDRFLWRPRAGGADNWTTKQ